MVRLHGTGVLLVVTLVLCGCAVGPVYQAPMLEPPPALTQPDGTDNGSLAAWWQAFDDPLLSRLLETAAERNHYLRIAAARIMEARALRGVAAGEFYPDSNASGSVARGRTSEDFPAPSFEGARTNWYYRSGLDAFWELDFWGRLRNQLLAADAELQASVADYRATLIVLMAEVATTYIDLRTIQQRLRFAQSNADNQRKTLQLTRDRVRAEIAPQLDIRQAELNLARTESVIPQLRSAATNRINRLSVLLGEMPGQLAGTLSQPLSIPDDPVRLAIGFPADILRRRPDIQRAEQLLVARTARIGVATAELYPQFALSGSFGFDATTDLLDSSRRSWGLGPAFTWNLFDGGRVRSFIQAEDARARQALATYEQSVLRALEEVETALHDYRQETLRHATLQQSVDAAASSVELVRTLYITGLTDFQNLLDMERTLFVQQDLLATSSGQILLDLIRIYKAAGGGWALTIRTAQSPDKDAGP